VSLAPWKSRLVPGKRRQAVVLPIRSLRDHPNAHKAPRGEAPYGWRFYCSEDHSATRLFQDYCVVRFRTISSKGFGAVARSLGQGGYKEEMVRAWLMLAACVEEFVRYPSREARNTTEERALAA
jgi:hypothetical protein